MITKGSREQKKIYTACTKQQNNMQAHSYMNVRNQKVTLSFDESLKTFGYFSSFSLIFLSVMILFAILVETMLEPSGASFCTILKNSEISLNCLYKENCEKIPQAHLKCLLLSSLSKPIFDKEIWVRPMSSSATSTSSQ